MQQTIKLTDEETKIAQPFFECCDALVKGYTQGVVDAKSAFLSALLKHRTPEAPQE